MKLIALQDLDLDEIKKAIQNLEKDKEWKHKI